MITIQRTTLILSVLLAAAVGAPAQEYSEVLPKVVQHAEPIYPPLARQTRIQGEVRVKVTTDGEAVRDVEAETGHPLLCKAAIDNVRTWKFATHAASTYHVTFRYKLLSDNVDVEFLESPAFVKVEAAPPEIICEYGWLGLGTWKAQIKGAHSKSSRVFKFAYSGPNGDWLSVNVVGPEAESEEIDFGHKEGDFLAFTKTLSQPAGKHVKTFFIGKMSGDKIVGTSVDEIGTRGKWTAIRITDSPKS